MREHVFFVFFAFSVETYNLAKIRTRKTRRGMKNLFNYFKCTQFARYILANEMVRRKGAARRTMSSFTLAERIVAYGKKIPSTKKYLINKFVIATNYGTLHYCIPRTHILSRSHDVRQPHFNRSWLREV